MATTDWQSSADLAELVERPPLGRRLMGHARKQPLGMAGFAVVLLMVVAAIFADIVAPFDPELNDFEHQFTAPGLPFLFGTDEFGRDIFSRIIYGSRTALYIGIVCAFFGATAGLVIGVASAYFGGVVDLVLQRVLDVFMAIPGIILALAIIAILGTGTEKVILAITLPFIPNCARVIRSSALAIREIPYVDAARALGFGHARIILRHMAPNVVAPYLIMLSAFVGQAILLEASLSFLGLGVQDPTPAWGLMLRGGAEEFAEAAPWVAIFPGIAISLAVFGFNLFGDAVRDILDPKLRSE